MNARCPGMDMIGKDAERSCQAPFEYRYFRVKISVNEMRGEKYVETTAANQVHRRR